MAAFWKKILFWKKPKMLIENKDYRFIDFENSEITGIELLMPDFLGVVYHYGKAKIVEEGEVGRVHFGYTLVHSGEHDMDTLNSDPKFHTIMGEILSLILIAKADDEARNNNSEKLNLF
jgi:hypothetical protein